MEKSFVLIYSVRVRERGMRIIQNDFKSRGLHKKIVLFCMDGGMFKEKV